MSADFCRHCGHHISDHATGFFSPCMTCGENEDGEPMCIDFEADDEDAPDPEEDDA